MTAITVDTVDTVVSNPGRADRGTPKRIPLTRVIAVELRKMFNTRSGFWLMASIVIAGVGTTVGIILLAPTSELTYYTFARAIGFPMAIILPMIAILAITGEWSQRSGLTTFTLVPRRNRVIAAKVLRPSESGSRRCSSPSPSGRRQRRRERDHRHRPGLGRLGRRGREHRARQPALPAHRHHAGHAHPQLRGRARRVLHVRVRAAQPVRVLTTSVDWFPDVQPWIDLNLAESFLFSGEVTGEQWANVAVTSRSGSSFPRSWDSASPCGPR